MLCLPAATTTSGNYRLICLQCGLASIAAVGIPGCGFIAALKRRLSDAALSRSPHVLGYSTSICPSEALQSIKSEIEKLRGDLYSSHRESLPDQQLALSPHPPSDRKPRGSPVRGRRHTSSHNWVVSHMLLTYSLLYRYHLHYAVPNSVISTFCKPSCTFELSSISNSPRFIKVHV